MSIEPQRPNVVLVGKKEPIQYVMAIIKLFQDGFEEVIVRARGKNICTAVEAVEMLRNVFDRNVSVGKVNIYSEKLQDERNRERSVTAIEIVLRKPRQQAEAQG